jgi:hypothetical protein
MATLALSESADETRAGAMDPDGSHASTMIAELQILHDRQS